MTTGYAPMFQGQDPLAPIVRVAQLELYKLLLNHLQGAFGTESQIDMVRPNGETTPSDVTAGLIVHIDRTTNTFKLGITHNSLGFFAKPAGGYAGVPASGNVYGDGILALPACAPYRLCTNNFAAANYPPGQALTCTGGGLLTPGTYYEDPIVGIAARGILTSYDKPGRDVLELFTYWLPAFTYAHSSNL